MNLHPWLATPEAYEAARKSVAIPMNLMGKAAVMIGSDELLSEALIVLTECALPPRSEAQVLCCECQKPLVAVRKGAKFCSPKCRMNHAKNVQRGKTEIIPARTGAHIGSMWAWPEDQMTTYAARQVGMCLNNYIRTRGHKVETPVFMTRDEDYDNWFSRGLEEGQDARDQIEQYLEAHGIRVEGTEALEELGEAAMNVRKAEQ